jgi:hypothetical protein
VFLLYFFFFVFFVLLFVGVVQCCNHIYYFSSQGRSPKKLESDLAIMETVLRLVEELKALVAEDFDWNTLYVDGV